MKYQAITTPCTLEIHLAGSMDGRCHDWTLYLQSGFEDILPADLADMYVHTYCVYGYSGYSACAFPYVPFRGSNTSTEEQDFKMAMSGSLATLECYFKEVKHFFRALYFKLRVQDSTIESLYIAGLLLTNFRNFFYPNSISQFSQCPPPYLESYVFHAR